MNHAQKIACCLLILVFIGCKSKVSNFSYFYEQGKYYEEKQQFDSAIYFYREALDLLKNLNEPEKTGETYNRLGDIFLETSLYEKAFDSYKEASKYNFHIADKTYYSKSLRGMGNSFAFRSMPDSAINYFLSILKWSASIKNKREILLIHNNLSNAYFETEQYDSALYHSNIAISLSKAAEDFYRESLMRADIFTKYQRYDSAWYYYELGSHSNDIFIKASCYWTLSELSQKLLKADSTKYLRMFSILNDSIDRLDQSVQVETADEKYLTHKVENDYERKLFFALSGVLLCIFISTVFIHFHKKKSSIHSQRQQEETQRKDGLITQLYNEMSILQHEINARKEQERNLSENDQRYERLEELIENVTKNMVNTAKICSRNFTRSSKYKNIKLKLQRTTPGLTPKERDYVHDTVMTYFDPLIKYLAIFMDMPKEDCFLCCLTLSKFSDKESSQIRCVSWSAIRSQKNRIKSRIIDTLHKPELYEFIFK